MKTREYGKEDMAVVKCSSCGSDMECPEEMMKAEKHICHVCTDILASGVDGENVKDMAEIEKDIEKHKDEMLFLGEFIHSHSFQSSMPPKDEIKEMSKKELAKEMHFAGVMTTIDFFMFAGLTGEDIKDMVKTIKEGKPQDSAQLKLFAREMTKVFDYIGAISEKLEKMGVGEEEFDRMIKSIDPKSMRTTDADPGTEGGLAIIMNSLIFKGDWQKQLEWTEKHGTKEDVETIKKMANLPQ